MSSEHEKYPALSVWIGTLRKPSHESDGAISAATPLDHVQGAVVVRAVGIAISITSAVASRRIHVRSRRSKIAVVRRTRRR